MKSLSELREEVVSLYETWKGRCGVLLFLYSVILTKVRLCVCLYVCILLCTLVCVHITTFLFLSLQSIENIRNEIEDTTEPLIDPVYGHGRYDP